MKLSSLSNMLTKFGIVIASIALLCAVACAPAAQTPASPNFNDGLPAHPNLLAADELTFAPGDVERWEFDNGLVVFYKYDDELPLVRGTLYLPGGSLVEPENLTGLAAAVGSQMRRGGTKSMHPSKLDAYLDGLGATIGSSYSGEYGVVEFSSLSEDFEDVFKLFYEVTVHPRFDNERLIIWKHLAADSIRRRRDNPGTMASMIFNAVVFGPEHPYARESTPESISKITQSSLKTFHQRFVRPLGAHLALSGAVPADTVKDALKHTFEKWVSDSKSEIVWPEAQNISKPGVYLLTRDFEQAQVYAGHIGPARLTPDIHSIVIFNRLFGFSGLDSLLFQEIRSRLGLAYSVYGGIFPGKTAGTFEVQMGTRNEEVLTAIQKLEELILYPRHTAFEPIGVDAARAAVRQSFVFKFPSNSALVNRAAILELLGYPKDYDATYLDKIAEVTPESVKSVAARWIHPENLFFVVVGNVEAESLRKALGDKIPVYEVGFDVIPRFENSALPD